MEKRAPAASFSRLLRVVGIFPVIVAVLIVLVVLIVFLLVAGSLVVTKGEKKIFWEKCEAKLVKNTRKCS